jgi:ketosteroid isomerase-like protein
MKKNISLIIVLLGASLFLTGAFGQEIKIRPKGQPKTAATTGAQSETKAGGAPEVKAEPAPEAKPETKAGDETVAKAEPAVVPKAGAESEGETACGLLTREKLLDAKLAEAGAQSAFGEFLSDDAKIIAATVIARKTWLAGLENDKSLKMNPLIVEASSSCDLGFVVGSWDEKKGKNFTRGGNYVSVWRKTKNDWRLCLHAKSLVTQKPAKEAAQETAVSQLDADDLKKAKIDVSEAEKNFFMTMKENGWAKAYDDYADENIMKLRVNGLMQKGKKGVFLKAVTERGYFEGKISKIETSKGRDLSVVWGEIEARGPQPYQKGSFLHIWVRNEAGEWKLLVDYAVLGRIEFKKSAL